MNDLFQKRFSFVKADNWVLPPISTLLQAELWTHTNLIDIKSDLNAVKSLLNDKGEQWQKHTSKINKAGFVINYIKTVFKPELLTQAWCKFYEILHQYDIISTNNGNFKSFHLCEAPGAFISALNYFLCLKHPTLCWQWLANTLNPYYEGHNIKNVIVDDRLIFRTLNFWHFGKDNTGDITSLNYFEDVQECCNEENLMNLVTADGSFSCLDNPGEQELAVSRLHFAELLIGLTILAPSGSFVIKKFTFFECLTACQLYFLCCVFNQVHVFKPFTSKAGNSEVYVICKGYIGRKEIMPYLNYMLEIYKSEKETIFPKSCIPESFMGQLLQCCNYFSSLQKTAIKENISLYTSGALDENFWNETKHKCGEMFLKKYSVTSLEDYEFRRLCQFQKQILTSFYDNDNRSCKDLYFQAFGETFENLKKSKTMQRSDIILDVQKRMEMCFPRSLKRPLNSLAWDQVWKEIPKRMKSKTYQNWITKGKKVFIIQNSKFCNPLILHLWNRVAQNSELSKSPAEINHLSYWAIEDAKGLLVQEENIIKCTLISVSMSPYPVVGIDSLLSNLKESFAQIQVCDLNHDLEALNMIEGKRSFFVNTLNWVASLHEECIVKNHLTKILLSIIKVLKEGDTCFICIQSTLTRYTVGLFFMFLSLFEKFLKLMPCTLAPPNCGQIWIFYNFKRPAWTNRVLNHLENILNAQLDEETDILEIVPISSLCGGYFYQYLLKSNNDYMLQRLRSLISIEKSH
ncbi:cap-specific mRNA (nucleoside-2'-O-)-methyltransferase 2-like [Uloborus diversus]|uniref:cap-specific mRNA (nucleoside-2'-O-)-methyltransferase 2-like n=1 Tax=Uloborus diversus TaxID=327109 RepID=UPI0024093C4E|nr:cap-specific mRNA (nucleoside-2'-O-)-methyltransferase 2-like [Uloborus diversus]